MRPIYIIFAVAVAGVYSELASYNYPPPSQPLQVGSSSDHLPSQLPLNQGYNYPSPPVFSPSNIRSTFQTNGLDNSGLGNTPLTTTIGGNFGRSPLRNQHQHIYEPSVVPINNIHHNTEDLSPFGNVPQHNLISGIVPHSEQVQKHVYVYVAPPEQVVAETKQVYVPSPVVNHKIIFIKAPTQSSTKSNVIPLPPKSEEKTLVYVLVKKQEEQEINVQPLPPQQASKPEVYFIKYNTKKGADNTGFPSGPVPGVVHPGNPSLPVVEDNFKVSQDPSTSQTFTKTSAVYGPPH